jgi:hypothetical protein
MRENLGNPSLLGHSLFRPFLQPGEKVVWSGRPGRLRWIGADNRQCFYAALIVGPGPSGIILLFMWLAARQSSWSDVSSHWLLWASLLAFAAIFLLSFAALALWRVGRLKKTVYALTNRRAIKLQTNKPEPNSISLDPINRFASKIRPDGSGDLAFGFQREDMQGQGRVRNLRSPSKISTTSPGS